MSKVMGILSNFGFFYDALSPNLIMSRDPRCNCFEDFSFCPNSTFNIMKSHKISSGKLSTSKGISKRYFTGGGDTPPPVPLGLRRILFIVQTRE